MPVMNGCRWAFIVKWEKKLIKIKCYYLNYPAMQLHVDTAVLLRRINIWLRLYPVRTIARMFYLPLRNKRKAA